MNIFKYILILTILSVGTMFSQKYVVAGYYPEWIKESFPVEKISFSNLTHIIHFSIWPDDKGNLVYENWFPYPELISKTHLEGKKVLLAVGGHNRSDSFVKMASSPTIRKKFLDSLMLFVVENNYDGVDWDWEFPSDEIEGELYLTLVKELRERFNQINTPLAITLATSSGNWIGQHFDYQKMDQYLDWFYLMSYDYHGDWLDHTGHIAPLYAPSTDTDGSVHESVVYLNETRGISKDKIVMGIPFYGRVYESEGLYQSFISPSTAVKYTYVDSLLNSGWDYKMDSYSKVPYLQDSGRTKLAVFDDPTSVEYKTTYIKSKKLAGAMIWHLGQDLVKEKQPLLEKIANELNITTSIKTTVQNSVEEFVLYDNYPNPFNPVTTIEYYIPKIKRRIVPVKLTIYDLLGQEVTILVDKYQKPGKYKVEFEANGLSSGNYIYELRAGEYVARKPMMYIK